VPFIQTIRRFEKRILEWDGSPGQIPTLDKRFITLDTTARWRIADPLRFFQSVGDERSAHARLDNLIDSAARDVVSSHLLIQTVRNFSRELPPQDLEEGGSGDEQRAGGPPLGTGVTPEVKPETEAPTAAQDVAPEERLGRDRLTTLMVKRARENLPNLGIELIDVRIRRINYVREVEQRVYERMISERQRIAARFRSEGDGASAKIRGEKERELDRVRSEAYRRAQEIIGKAEAEAAQIYAEAYGQDQKFYEFLQTLETYKHTLQKNSSLLLTTDSDFYRYLKHADGLSPQTALTQRR
jgi:membrane protease subunit HflC